jgi:putative exporter of polyketide antibiotics
MGAWLAIFISFIIISSFYYALSRPVFQKGFLKLNYNKKNKRKTAHSASYMLVLDNENDFLFFYFVVLCLVCDSKINIFFLPM